MKGLISVFNVKPAVSKGHPNWQLEKIPFVCVWIRMKKEWKHGDKVQHRYVSHHLQPRPNSDLQDRLWPFTMDPPMPSCGSKPKVVLGRELMGGGVVTGLDVFSYLQGEIANQWQPVPASTVFEGPHHKEKLAIALLSPSQSYAKYLLWLM